VSVGIKKLPAPILVVVFGVFFFGASLSGCTSVSTRLPMPDPGLVESETRVQEERAFLRYHTMLVRLEGISANILQANASLCAKTTYDLGITTHRLKSYPKELRSAAMRWIGAGETPAVLLVRKDSIAAKAGMMVGDVLLGPKGRAVAAYAEQTLAGGGQLSIRRAGQDMVLDVERPLPKTCDYPVRLSFSSAVNAYANGRQITVTMAMMDFVENDRQLAMVLGHELAHNTMGHVRKIVTNVILSGFATRYTRPFEAEADYVGLYYMARAGYGVAGVEDFWRRLGVQNPKSAVRAKSHPATPTRSLSLQLAAEEIVKKQQQNQALIPNYKDGKAPKNVP